MDKRCVYLQVLVQMYLRGLDTHTLAKQTGVGYSTLRRKLRGESPLHLDEAQRIRQVLGCEMPLEALFEKREAVHEA